MKTVNDDYSHEAAQSFNYEKSLQNCITKSNNQQTDSFASESLNRFQDILSGPYSRFVLFLRIVLFVRMFCLYA